MNVAKYARQMFERVGEGTLDVLPVYQQQLHA
jgi:hypothetical protein